MWYNRMIGLEGEILRFQPLRVYDASQQCNAMTVSELYDNDKVGVSCLSIFHCHVSR